MAEWLPIGGCYEAEWLSAECWVAEWLSGCRVSVGRWLSAECWVAMRLSAKFGTNQSTKAANPTHSATQFYAKNRIICKKAKSQKAHTTAIFSADVDFIAKICFCIKPKNMRKIFH